MIVAPPSRLKERQCARCGGTDGQCGVWVVTLNGRLTLHAGCAQALLGDLEHDLQALVNVIVGGEKEPAR